MALCRYRYFAPALAALLAAVPLAAQEVGTRPSPPPRVIFRSATFRGDLKLREPGVAQPPAPPPAVAVIPTGLPAAETVTKGTPPSPAKTASAANPAVPRAIPTFRTFTTRGTVPAGGRDLALQPTTFTPYDRYLGTVRTVINNLAPQPANMMLAARLMKEGRRMSYCMSDPYRADPPAVTAARRAGDCKSKALWLYNQLGDSNALFVIGKVQRRARTSHAWVYWRYDDRWWILDCTERTDPIAADSVSSDRYVPYYSFGKTGTFRHSATRIMMASALYPSASPVAAKK
ncbi:MAG: hypothetical protein K8R23_18495 [Chthoniobacter sp.]|nr:hypothetical protein [Chthoniobacter sp.]